MSPPPPPRLQGLLWKVAAPPYLREAEPCGADWSCFSWKNIPKVHGLPSQVQLARSINSIDPQDVEHTVEVWHGTDAKLYLIKGRFEGQILWLWTPHSWRRDDAHPEWWVNDEKHKRIVTYTYVTFTLSDCSVCITNWSPYRDDWVIQYPPRCHITTTM